MPALARVTMGCAAAGTVGEFSGGVLAVVDPIGDDGAGAEVDPMGDGTEVLGAVGLGCGLGAAG